MQAVSGLGRWGRGRLALNTGRGDHGRAGGQYNPPASLAEHSSGLPLLSRRRSDVRYSGPWRRSSVTLYSLPVVRAFGSRPGVSAASGADAPSRRRESTLLNGGGPREAERPGRMNTSRRIRQTSGGSQNDSTEPGAYFREGGKKVLLRGRGAYGGCHSSTWGNRGAQQRRGARAEMAGGITSVAMQNIPAQGSDHWGCRQQRSVPVAKPAVDPVRC